MHRTLPRLLAIAAAAVAPALTSTAWANRPLTTDTADVLPDGSSQLEVFAERLRAAGEPSVNGWTAQISHGIGYRTQLSAAFSRARAEGESASGLVVGGKTWLVELGDSSPGLTLGYGLTAEKAPGDSWEQDGVYVMLIGTQPVGDSLLLHGNLGWERSRLAKRNSTTWAIGAEWSATEVIDLVAETFGDDRGKPMWSIGALWQVMPNVSVNTSYGMSRDTPRVKQWTFGFQIDF